MQATENETLALSAKGTEFTPKADFHHTAMDLGHKQQA